MEAIVPRVVSAQITPYDQHGELDLGAQRHNLETLWERGVHGFLMAGSTGEGVYLERGERSRLIGTARDCLGAAAFLICGITTQTEREAMTQLAEAVEGGADAGLVVTPTTLIRGRTELVSDYFERLAESSPLPLMIYSVPPVTGYEYPIPNAITTLKLANVVGMKDSGGDVARIQAICAAIGADETEKTLTESSPLLYNGASRAISMSMYAGAYGVIAASVNYATSKAIELTEAAISDSDGMAEINTNQAQLTEIATTIEAYGVGGIKTAAEMVGLAPAHFRHPLQPVNSNIRSQISTVLSKYGLI